jgi:HTH-type transcriptional regulator / antitoxin HigA
MDEQQFMPDWFSKPGDSLRSLMQRRSVTAGELAHRLDEGMTTVRGILNGSITLGVPPALPGRQ